MTIEEFWIKNTGRNITQEEYSAVTKCTKHYVEEALKAATKKDLINRKPTGEGQSSEEETSISFYGDLGYEDYIPVEYTVNEDSILNAYPESNIE